MLYILKGNFAVHSKRITNPIQSYQLSTELSKQLV